MDGSRTKYPYVLLCFTGDTKTGEDVKYYIQQNRAMNFKSDGFFIAVYNSANQIEIL